MGVYVSVSEMRAQGVPETVSTDRLQELEALARDWIERSTGLYFDKRTSETVLLDGPGTPILELPAPALSLTSVKIEGVAVDATDYVNYNRRNGEDFLYPRLVFKGEFSRMERAFWPQPARRSWPIGDQNVEVVGTFGWVESDDSTPAAIKRAALLLVVGMMDDVGKADADENRRRRYLTGERLGNYSYTLSDAAQGDGLGDPEVERLLLPYHRPSMSAR